MDAPVISSSVSSLSGRTPPAYSSEDASVSSSRPRKSCSVDSSVSSSQVKESSSKAASAKAGPENAQADSASDSRAAAVLFPFPFLFFHRFSSVFLISVPFLNSAFAYDVHMHSYTGLKVTENRAAKF